MAARRPRFSGNESTVAPPSRAIAAVSSVEPSSMTRTSASGSSPRSSSSTAGRLSSSFQAGTKTIVSLRGSTRARLPAGRPRCALAPGSGLHAGGYGILGHPPGATGITSAFFDDRLLREARELFEQVFNGSSDAFLVAHLDAPGIIEVSDAFVRLTGVSREAAVASPDG